MIKGIKKLVIHDANSDKEIKVEIKDGNLVFTNLDFTIAADELVSLAFFIAKPEFQDSFFKDTQREVRQYRKQHVVKVKKAMAEGEEIIVNCEVNVPLLVENKIKEELYAKENNKESISTNSEGSSN